MTRAPLIETDTASPRPLTSGPALAALSAQTPTPVVAPSGYAFMVKYGADRLVAALLLLLGAPLFAMVAASVRLSSSGPVFFRQTRVGRDGREFTMFKFRTMFVASPDGTLYDPIPGHAPGGVEGDDRRTRVGIWLRGAALDELPQLINVLRGEMSLIGPRPERPEYVALFRATVAGYDQRHDVKPGLTGLAQVNGFRGPGPLSARVALDLAYIRDWSPWLDLRIAVRTARALTLRGEGT